MGDRNSVFRTRFTGEIEGRSLRFNLLGNKGSRQGSIIQLIDVRWAEKRSNGFDPASPVPLLLVVFGSGKGAK